MIGRVGGRESWWPTTSVSILGLPILLLSLPMVKKEVREKEKEEKSGYSGWRTSGRERVSFQGGNAIGTKGESSLSTTSYISA